MNDLPNIMLKIESFYDFLFDFIVLNLELNIVTVWGLIVLYFTPLKKLKIFNNK